MPHPKAHAAALDASPEDAEGQFHETVRDGDPTRRVAHHANPGAPGEIPELIHTPSILH